MGALRLKVGKDLGLDPRKQLGTAVGYRLPRCLKTTVKAADGNAPSVHLTEKT
ncbi:hypothetical protein ACNKHV_11505 [Shigella flexneri]